MMMMMLHTLHTNTNQKTFSEYKKKQPEGKGWARVKVKRGSGTVICKLLSKPPDFNFRIQNSEEPSPCSAPKLCQEGCRRSSLGGKPLLLSLFPPLWTLLLLLTRSIAGYIANIATYLLPCV